MGGEGYMGSSTTTGHGPPFAETGKSLARREPVRAGICSGGTTYVPDFKEPYLFHFLSDSGL